MDPTKFSITDINLKGKYALVCERVSFRVQGKAPQFGDLALVAHGPVADLNIEHLKQSDGSYMCSFVPIEPGSYEVYVEFAGRHVNGSPFTVLVADPSKCHILGKMTDTIQVGGPEEIVLKTRGAGAGEIEVYVDGEKESDLLEYKIDNQGLDTFCVTLTGKKVCQASLGIHWAGYSIPRAPFSLKVCDANLCKAFGNVLMTKKGKAGEQVAFTVVTHRAGQAELTVKAKGPSALYNVDLKPIKEATYEASFTPWEIGEHSIDILWGPVHIPKSPFMISVANPMDRVVCNATGPGLKHAISNKPATFTIMSNEVGLLDKNALKISVIGVQSHAEVTVKDRNNGCYNVSYIAPTSGAYIASISFYDRQIPGSPFKINVVPGPDATKCRAYGPALHPNAMHIAGTPLELSVDCSEGGYGNLRIYVQGPNDYRPRIFMADDGKGVYSIKFDAMKSGKYFVVIAWAEKHIPGSPFKLKVHPAANASKVKVYGPGLTDGRLGDEGEFSIDTKRAGIGTLLVRVHGIRDSFKVEAHPVSSDKPRLLLAHYYPTISGEFTIFVRWSGVHVPGSPFTVVIREADGSLPDILSSPIYPLQLPEAAQSSSPEEAEVQQQALTETEIADDREAKSTTATSKKSSKKKPSAKKDKTSTKKAGKDKQKTKKQTPPPSIGPVPTNLKMRSSPMGGFTVPATVQPGPLPPGTVVAPDGQLFVRSSSGEFVPLHVQQPPVHYTKRVVTMEKGVEKKPRHRSSSSGNPVRPISPTRSPPVSPTHVGAGPTFDLPQKQQSKRKKPRKF
jgi:filamin